jgi:hypothetical protein
MTLATFLFEGFTGLAAVVACAVAIAAFVSEPAQERNDVEWTLRRRS